MNFIQEERKKLLPSLTLKKQTNDQKIRNTIDDNNIKEQCS